MMSKDPSKIEPLLALRDGRLVSLGAEALHLWVLVEDANAWAWRLADETRPIREERMYHDAEQWLEELAQ